MLCALPTPWAGMPRATGAAGGPRLQKEVAYTQRRLFLVVDRENPNKPTVHNFGRGFCDLRTTLTALCAAR